MECCVPDLMNLGATPKEDGSQHNSGCSVGIQTAQWAARMGLVAVNGVRGLFASLVLRIDNVVLKPCHQNPQLGGQHQRRRHCLSRQSSGPTGGWNRQVPRGTVSTLFHESPVLGGMLLALQLWWHPTQRLASADHAGGWGCTWAFRCWSARTIHTVSSWHIRCLLMGTTGCQMYTNTS